MEHPQEATKIFHKANPSTNLVVSRKMWDITVEHLMTPYAMKHGIGMMSREKMAKSQETIAKALKVKFGPVEGLFTNEFLPKLFPKKPEM